MRSWLKGILLGSAAIFLGAATTGGLGPNVAPVSANGGTFNNGFTIKGSIYYAKDPQYGTCTWDSTHDVGPCIGRAFTAALAGGGGTVMLPAGNFGVLTPWTIPAGSYGLQGALGGTTLTAMAGAAGSTLFFSAGSTVMGLLTKDITFDGNSTAVGADIIYFQATDASNVIFDGVTVQNNRYVVAGFTRTTRSGFRNSHFDNVGNYFKNGGPYALTVTNSYNGASGTSNFFDNNVVTNVGGDPFDASNQLAFSAKNNRIIGDNTGWINLTTGAGIGIYLTGTTGSVGGIFDGTYVYGLTGNGIDINCGSNFAVGNFVSNHNGGAGIALSGTPTCPLTNFSLGTGVTMDNWQGIAGRVTLSTNGTTANGNAVLHFASTTGVVDGYYVDSATAGSITAPTKVLSHDATTVTLDTVTTGVANPQVMYFLPSYGKIPAPDSGIWIGCVGGACNVNNFSIGGITATDDQTPKTQDFGVHASSDVTLATYTLSGSAMLSGNLAGTTNSIAQQVYALANSQTGMTQYSVGSIYTTTANQTVNTTGATSVFGTGIGTQTIPANSVATGTKFRMRASGLYTTPGSAPGTLTVTVNWGATSLMSMGSGTLATSVSSKELEIFVECTVRTTGGTGTIICGGKTTIFNSGLTSQALIAISGAGATTIDTTANKVLDITATLSAGAAGTDQIVFSQGSIEIVN